MPHSVLIQEIGFITHNVLRIKTERPTNYNFEPGQATDVAVDRIKWRDEKRVFTFTSLPKDGFLEFVIKVYPSHDGMTDVLQTVEAGEHLLLDEPWGAISYKGAGVFLAGGAGITPFIAILKDLATKNALAGNKLLFSNKRERDIILASDFQKWLGKDFITTLSDEKNSRHEYGRINKEFIKNNIDTIDQYFYMCGPPSMTKALTQDLKDLGVSQNKMIGEKFS